VTNSTRVKLARVGLFLSFGAAAVCGACERRLRQDAGTVLPQ
jgi:hypothetical protein